MMTKRMLRPNGRSLDATKLAAGQRESQADHGEWPSVGIRQTALGVGITLRGGQTGR
jgi:hypothetical protein